MTKVDASEQQQLPTVLSDKPILEQVNLELAQELRSAEEALATEHSKNEDLVEKLSKLLQTIRSCAPEFKQLYHD